MAKYEARFKQLQQELAHARSVLPDTADVPQLLSHLGNKAHETGLQIDFFEPQEETDKGFYSEITFGMKLRGSFHEIATFVDAIGKMDRIVDVAGVSMTNPSSVNQKIIVQGLFDFKVLCSRPSCPQGPFWSSKFGLLIVFHLKSPVFRVLMPAGAFLELRKYTFAIFVDLT